MSVMNEGTPETLESLAKWMESCSKSAKSDSPANTKIIRQAYTRIAKALRRLDEIQKMVALKPSEVEDLRTISKLFKAQGSKEPAGLSALVSIFVKLNEKAW